ncbi:MAG: glycosyltransferase family 2 protein, partial [Sandaracinaceae bacterium]
PAPRGHGAPRASVIVPTRGGPALAQCLAAVRAYTRVPVELVVVDDASGAVDLHALPEGTRLVRLDARRGFVGAANAGARAAQTGLLVFLNDDVIVTPGWLEALEAALASPRAALVAPSSNDTGDAATIGARYRGLAELLRFSAERRGPPVEVDKLSLACAAIRKGTFDGVGGLDEGYGLGLFEDDELCRSLRARGGRILLVGDAYVHHHGSLTFDTLGSAARIARFEINRHRFEQRWRTRWRAP